MISQDENGRFSFDVKLKPVRAVAADGLGHWAGYNFAADGSEQ